MMTRCTLCEREHSNMHGLEPHRYCETCAVLKAQYKGVITEVIPGQLYLGDMHTPSQFEGKVICVHESDYAYTKGVHIKILSKLPNGPYDRRGAIATTEQLQAVSIVIEAFTRYVTNFAPVLVHCVGGVERSPLAVAYHLQRVMYKGIMGIEEAYDYLIEKRPIVSRRLYWLGL